MQALCGNWRDNRQVQATGAAPSPMVVPSALLLVEIIVMR
jgi:hypothetical protein